MGVGWEGWWTVEVAGNLVLVVYGVQWAVFCLLQALPVMVVFMCMWTVMGSFCTCH